MFGVSTAATVNIGGRWHYLPVGKRKRHAKEAARESRRYQLSPVFFGLGERNPTNGRPSLFIVPNALEIIRISFAV